jgi:hypothetical protein
MLVNKILSPLGWAFVRVERAPWFHRKVMTAHLGRYSIQVPGINPISTHYARQPDYMGQLGRLVSLLKVKYPDLAAIDIGANVGDTACIIKSAADIPLWCIEGDDRIFGLLEQNLRQFQHTSAHQLFLG